MGGEHFSLSESKKLMGRQTIKTKELFETKSPQEMIEDGTLQLMGTRSVKPQFDHGIFRLLVDDQSNRKIEIAFQGDVTVFTFDTDQEILDIILEGEENFIRVHQSENSVTISGNGISDENNDLFKSTPKGILMELLKAPKCTKGPEMANNLHSVFANSDIKSIISECNYDAEKETLVFKESTSGRCYVRKMQIMPAAIFQTTSVSAPAVEENVVIKEVEKPVKSQPPTPKPAAVAGGALS